MQPLGKTHHKRHWPARQRGAVAILLTVALVSLLAMAGLALDGGHLMLNKTRLQNAVDAAALSGAKTLSQVMGASGSASTARSDALDTFARNASAPGNGELASAMGSNVGSFARVEFASSVYGPFSFPGPADASYVKVTVPEYGLAGFFWRFLQSLGGGLGDKQVAAVAVAGPSPTQPCNISPLMVCGDKSKHDPAGGKYWGFEKGQLQVLKTASGNSSPIGPGNFQIIRLGNDTGGADFRDALAGDTKKCLTDKYVETEPGNKVGPAIQALNVRFNEYNGSIKPGDYPPDLVTKYSHVGNNALELKDGAIEYQGKQAKSDTSGNVYTDSNDLFDLKDWREESAKCMAGNGGECQSNGVFERRILRIVVGQCSGTDGGQSSVEVLGVGCYFVLQPATQKGNEAHIFGQFEKNCTADGYPGANPVKDVGPQIIQLYKTFTNGPGTPGADS